MYRKVLEFIIKNQLFARGDRVIAAVSGGADSVCLLRVLVKFSDQLGISLRAVHIHHGLRGEEADRDAAYVEEICGRWSVPVSAIRRDVKTYAKEHGLSTEEAGRILRYEVFEEEAQKWGGAKIAVAHHADDRAETILFNLFRGSGLKGLGGIRPIRDNIVRPMLEISRAEILAFLQEEGIEYCEDSTNFENDYARNRIRNRLIPLAVSEINAKAVENILRAGELAAEADAYLERTADGLLGRWGRSEDGRVGMPAALLGREEPIVQAYIIRRMLAAVSRSEKDITAKHIELVCGLIDKTVGKRADLPYGMTAVRGYDCVWIKTDRQEDAVGIAADEDAQPLTFDQFSYEKGMEIPKNQYTKWFDYDKIKGMLSVRYRETGDYITLTSGGRKSVKSYMIDEKIPRSERDRILLLAEENHVLWIVGYRISEYYKITEHTKKVLQVYFHGGENHGG